MCPVLLEIQKCFYCIRYAYLDALKIMQVIVFQSIILFLSKFDLEMNLGKFSRVNPEMH